MSQTMFAIIEAIPQVLQLVVAVLTPQLSIADVARGMIGFTIFYSAYVAEYVRSGLQAVPRGQVDDTSALIEEYRAGKYEDGFGALSGHC